MSNFTRVLFASSEKSSYWLSAVGLATGSFGAQSRGMGILSTGKIILNFHDSSGQQAGNARLSVDGTMDWIQRKGTGAGSNGPSMDTAIDSNDNFLVVNGASAGGYLKHNSLGVPLAGFKGGSTGIYSASAIYIDSSDNTYVGAWKAGAPYNPVVAKINSAGTLQWIRHIGDASNQNSNLNSVFTDSSANVYLGGQTGVNPNTAIFGYKDAQIAKYNTSGTLQWIYNYGASGIQMNEPMGSADSSGNTYWSGNANTPTFKLNSSGVVQWSKAYTTGSITMQGSKIGPDGNLYLYGDVGYNRFLACWDTDGNELWALTFGHTSASYNNYDLGGGTQNWIGFDNDGSIYVQFNFLITGNQSWNACIKLPNDGTLTGTYDGWVIQSVSETIASVSLSRGSQTWNSGTNTTWTSYTLPTYTDMSNTWTNTVDKLG